jgi:hypothetical protein
MIKATLGLSVLLTVLSPSAARADAGVGGGQTLQRPIGARGPAMGTAFVAADGGVDSLGYNPAGLSTAAHPALQTSYTRGVVDDFFTYAAYVHPLPIGVLALGGIYYDAGNIHITLSDGTDKVVKAQQDYVEMVGLGLNLGRGVSIGGVAKVYQFSLAQVAHAQGFAADAGLIWHTPVENLNAGASAQNMGPNIRYESAGDTLPRTYRGGLAYTLDAQQFDWLDKEGSTFLMKYLFTADGVFTDGLRPAAAVGTEMDMAILKGVHGAIRAGYLFNRDIDGFSLGAGFRERHVIVDYAFGLQKALGDVHRISIGYEF